jgi:ferrochelatase
MKKGLLLINLGTPNSPSLYEVGKYLQEFLCDPRVIDCPKVFRYLLFFGLIVPFRLRKTVQAYQHIWTKKGSPLLVNSHILLNALQSKLKNSHEVKLAMRYGEPSIEQALHSLNDCEEITILPLYPQYASASTGSSLEAVFSYFNKQLNIPTLRIIHEFYEHPGFIEAQVALIQPHLNDHEFVLFSYHGLPERQVLQGGCSGICKAACPVGAKSACYRARCFQTTKLIAQSLKLNATSFDTSFQSRLGRIPWIQPYTETHLSTLRQRGIKRLLVVAPSFTADCLETLDEIGHLAHDSWLKLGGEKLTLVPSLNGSDAWVTGVIQMLLSHLKVN